MPRHSDKRRRSAKRKRQRSGQKPRSSKHPPAVVPGPIWKPAQAAALSPADRLDWRDALHALSLMRRRGLSRAAAAREMGISLETFQKYAGPALRRDKYGRYRSTKADTLLRQIRYDTPRGPIWLDVKDSRTAALLGQYAAARGQFRERGDYSGLRKLKGKKIRVGGVIYPLITDPVTVTMIDERQTIEYEHYKQ
jgi:predicted DNA-binding protein (UPF0251 family)